MTTLQKTPYEVVTTSHHRGKCEGAWQEILIAYLGLDPSLHTRPCCTGVPPRMAASLHDEMEEKEMVAHRRGQMCEVARLYDRQPAVLRADWLFKTSISPSRG